MWAPPFELREQKAALSGYRRVQSKEEMKRPTSMRLILLIIVILLLIGSLPSWPYSSGWGYYPAGGLGTILIILLILALVGVI
jgi:hypothetical protein